MNTIIRAHVKNEKRLETLKREIESWKDKRMLMLGMIYVVDDNSPLALDVEMLCREYSVEYVKAEGKPDTKNGLYNSLKLSSMVGNSEDLFCVDDAVFGQGIVNQLLKYRQHDRYLIPNRGTVGLFACYENQTRNPCHVEETDLWGIPLDILYGLVAHVFSINLRDTLIYEWEEIVAGKQPYPQMCDDLWVKEVCKKYGLNCYNTMLDYAQHVGGDNRTFGDSGENSNYFTKMFVGE